MGELARGIGGENRTETVLHHPAAVDDEYLVGPLQGGEPVGDDDPGAASEKLVDGAFYQPLGGRVEPRRRLVQHDQPGIGEKGTGEGEQLTLAGRQTTPTGWEDGVET